MNKLTHVLIPVGGFGTRLRPLSEFIPKAMMPIGRWFALDLLLAEAVDAHLTPVVLTTANSQVIERYLLGKGVETVRTDPTRFDWSVGMVADRFSEGVAVALPDEISCPDEPVLPVVAAAYTRWGRSIVAVRAAEGVYRIGGMTSAPHTVAGTSNGPPDLLGRYAFTGSALARLGSSSGVKELMRDLSGEGELVGAGVGNRPFFDIGTLDGYGRTLQWFLQREIAAST